MEITFNKCVRCRKSMRNRLGMISWKRSMQGHFRCPHCCLLYFSANSPNFEGPWQVSVPWNLGFIFLLICSIITFKNESLIAGCIFGGLSVLYSMYTSPHVAMRSLRE